MRASYSFWQAIGFPETDPSKRQESGKSKAAEMNQPFNCFLQYGPCARFDSRKNPSFRKMHGCYKFNRGLDL
jgi:hypothetical protein